MNVNTRGRIVLLVVLAALPALAFTVYSARDERVRAEVHAREELARLAGLAAQQQGEVIEGARQMLAAVSLVPDVVRNDPERCNAYLAMLLARSRGLYHSIGIYDADDVLVCNALPWSGTIRSPDRLYIRLAHETGQFAVGDYQVGRVTGLQGINLGYPIKSDEGTVTGVSFAAVDLENFNRVAVHTPLPRRGILTVVDRDNRVLARKPADAGRVGRPLSNSAVVRNLAEGKSGVFQARGNDGVDRLFAHDVVFENAAGPAPVRVFISLPLDVVYAEANYAFLRNLAGIVAVTVLLVFAAWFGAEIFVLRKIRTLLGAASRVRAGDLTARTGMRNDGEELSQVGQAFDEMTHALEQRDEELKRALQDLHEQAITDPLTGLVNRRYLREYLPRELTRAKRKEVPLAVIMVDLDHFKRVNDSFGHEAGDLVLRSLGALLLGQIRASDVACRFGGEEFALVLPEIPVEDAVQRAEAIRSGVRNLDLNYAGQPIGPLTASFGIAAFPDQGQDADSLLRLADEALYQAKGAGRDRVMVSGDAAKGAPPGVML